MKILKLWFTDFDELFNPSDNFLYNLLSYNYKIILDSRNPDYIIYSCYGNKFIDYQCVRIFYTAENLLPDFNLCDFAIGFAYLDFEDRYLRFPYFATFDDQFSQLTEPRNFSESILTEKKYFCNFIYANSSADPHRDMFFNALNQYKAISSPGKHLNNIEMDIGGRFTKDWMYSKIDFQSKCKFTLAFENTSSPGYTTEKILHAFNSNTIPIYWGNPEIARDFNPRSFINCHDFENFPKVIEEIKKIDTNSELYISMLNQSAFENNIIPSNLEKKNFLQFLINIFEKDDTQKRSKFGTQAKYEKNLKANIRLKRKYERISKYLNLFKDSR